jgi:hypothetical protein
MLNHTPGKNGLSLAKIMKLKKTKDIGIEID